MALISSLPLKPEALGSVAVAWPWHKDRHRDQRNGVESCTCTVRRFLPTVRR